MSRPDTNGLDGPCMGKWSSQDPPYLMTLVSGPLLTPREGPDCVSIGKQKYLTYKNKIKGFFSAICNFLWLGYIWKLTYFFLNRSKIEADMVKIAVKSEFPKI